MTPATPPEASARSTHGGYIGDTVGHKSTHVTETVYRHVIRSTIRGGATVMDNVSGDPDDKAGN